MRLMLSPAVLSLKETDKNSSTHYEATFKLDFRWKLAMAWISSCLLLEISVARWSGKI